MQRVTSILPSWDRTKAGSKKGFDKAWSWADKLGAPVNRLSNKIGSEAFWPTTLDKESDKAARILRSFCKDGFFGEEDRISSADFPNGTQRVLKKIPQSVIQNAVGLAIFTTMRTGLWISGAGGSGVLVARKENGDWSPPSGIILHTAGLGFLVGVDIYDCVVVINNRRALDAFTKIRATLGGEISAVAGPVGIGGVLENDGKWKQANRPVFTYLKSRGFYAGVQVDGTVIIERSDENERFYGQKIGVADILAGKVRHPPYETKMLMETLKAAEGRIDVDRSMMDDLEGQPAPGDIDIVSPATASSPSFGIPEPDDPDPFGVLALENAGLAIKEAGSKTRPPSSQFEYNPSPTSPLYSRFHRQSMDTLATGNSNRESYMSNRSIRTARTSTDRWTQTCEMGTQTDYLSSAPGTSLSHNDENKMIVEEEEMPIVIEPEEIDFTKIDLGPYSGSNRSEDLDGITVNGSPQEHDGSERLAIRVDATSPSDDEDDDLDLDDEEPVIFEAASAQATAVLRPQAIKARGGLVNIPKRPPPPPLPPRSIARRSRNEMIDQASGRTPMTSEFSDISRSTSASPVKSDFEEVDLHGSNRNSGENSPEPATEKDILIVLEDLEKTETGKESANEPLDAKTGQALEGQRLQNYTPTSETTTPVHEAENQHSLKENLAPVAEDSPEFIEPESEVSNESEKVKDIKVSGGIDDEESFHSIPTTPLEAKEVNSSWI